MSTVQLDSDVLRSASHLNMAEHLTAPFAGGAQSTDVAISTEATALVDWESREPLLLAAPLAPLGAGELVLAASVSEGAQKTSTLTFAPYSETGAFLPLYQPAVDAVLRTAQPFSITLTLSSRDGAGEPLAPIAASEVAALIELQLLEGITGRLLYVMAAEKQRIRRTAREIAQMRLLASARDDALDRAGADLGVQRLQTSLQWDAESHEIVTQSLGEPEPDQDYRRRIGLYRPLLMSTPANVSELLNGPGTSGEPNAGALAQISPGLQARFTLTEAPEPFAVAVHLVSCGGDGYRTEFLQYVRDTRLLWPLDEAAANAAHAGRFLPTQERERVERTRGEMRAGYSFVADAAAEPALAPQLAQALNRLAACRAALGAAGPLQISRVQQNEGGSRYELGLGANLASQTAAELDQLGGTLAKPGRAPAADPEAEALLAAMTPVSSGSDPDGRWLLEPCGLRTVHRLDANTLYVSCLPVFGLLVEGSSQAPFEGWSLLVAGNFGGPRGTDVFAYRRETGEGQFFAVEDGALSALAAPIAGLSGNWSSIVSGNFGQGETGTDALLCYDQAQGRLECMTYTRETNALVALGAPSTGWSTTVSQMLTGEFGAVGHTNVVLYDPVQGRLEFLDGDFPAPGRIGPPVQEVGGGWTHLVAGGFQEDGGDALVLYDAGAGRGAIYALGAPGRLSLLSERSDWPRGCSHLLTVEGGTLLFHDRDEGTVELDTVDAQGGLTTISTPEDWPRGLTHVVTGSWAADRRRYERRRPGRIEGGYTGLLLYDATRGRGELAQLQEDASLQRLGSFAGPAPSSLALEGHYYAAESSSSNAVLQAGLTEALAAWSSTGGESPTLLGQSEASTAWAHAAVNENARQALQDGGLPNVPDPVALAGQLPGLPSDQVATLRLGPTLTQSVLAGQGTEAIKSLSGALAAADIPSAVGFATSEGQVLIVVSVIGLPVAGLNLAERPTSGFRWYTVPLAGMRASIGASGSRVQLTSAGRGLNAVVLVGYARSSGVPDPYQFTVDLPERAALSLSQYEFLMNLLDHAHPAGVGVNTYAIRRRHVALDGTIAALTPSLSHTYRPFRGARGRGVLAETGAEDA